MTDKPTTLSEHFRRIQAERRARMGDDGYREMMARMGRKGRGRKKPGSGDKTRGADRKGGWPRKEQA